MRNRKGGPPTKRSFAHKVMNGIPESRYVSEEEMNLGPPNGGVVGGPSSPVNPFTVGDANGDFSYDDDDGTSLGSDSGYKNGDDAYPEYGEVPSGSPGGGGGGVELWQDDIRANNNRERRSPVSGGRSIEMVPLSGDEDARRNGNSGESAAYQTLDITHPSSGDDYQSSKTLLPRSVYHFLYPPDVPRAVQLMRPENIAVPACYLLVGLLQGLSGPFANVYPLDLNASEAQQATISSLKSLPSTFKLAFGFLSDNLPLCGYRRKSYMLLGWTVTSLSMVMLLFFSDLSQEAVDATNSAGEEGVDGSVEDDYVGRYLEDRQHQIYQPQSITGGVGEPPSIPFLSFSILLFGTGFWWADVMGDSLVAEKAKLEPESSRGHLQSTCYACRFFGLMIAAPCSTVIYSSLGPQYVVLVMAALPAMMIPLICMLSEQKNAPVASTKEQCGEIWNTVCSRAVWQPMGFVYLYNTLQVGNAAWKQFLKTVLGFTSNQLNTLLIVAYVLLWLGIMAYKKFFIKWSWRTVYISTTLLNGVFSALQILLIKGITFGLSPFLFALGDDAFADFIGGIQFLPTTIMMVHLCPSGSEGASYAMFTTLSNSAATVATAYSTMLLGTWDVSKEAMEKGDLQGMVNLTALTTLIQVSGVLFVGLLPKTKDDLMQLSYSSRSKIGGFCFLFITLASVAYSLVVGILNTVHPGWAGES